MKRKYYISIDIGATNTKFAILSPGATIIKKKVIPTSLYESPAEFVSISYDIIQLLLREVRAKRRDIAGIGIGAPGAINSEKGIVHYFVNIRGWKEVYLKRMMEQKTRILTFVENDVNVMALGEFHYGAGKKVKNMIGITLGSGVGSGLILNGNIYEGADYAAGEIGHIPIAITGKRCMCGGIGCMETYVGNKYIVKRAIREMKGRKTLIKKLIKDASRKLSPKVIYEAAKKKDRLAIKILEDTGMYLGVCLAGVVNMLNPELIVIGGGVSNAGHFILNAVKRTVRKRAMQLPSKTVRIVKAKLGENAGLIGGLALVKEKSSS